jgi:hypothetical protein
MNLVNYLLTLGGFLVAVWATLKYFVFYEMRIDANTFKTLFEVLKSEKTFLIREEFVSDVKPPIEYVAFCFVQNAPVFFLSHSERLMTAGWTSKDNISYVTCFRWNANRLKDFLKIKLQELQLEKLGLVVELLTPHFTDRIGALKKEFPEPILPEKFWKDIDQDVLRVVSGELAKTSVLLYGQPGNGKTSFVKYLATKYKLPIKVVTLDPQFSNHDLMAMFGQITPNCLVLFEDFDNYFDKRECIIGNGNMEIRFTFDIILNALDGVYNSFEQVVFVMTVNDIEKVDESLKNRPSRFKFVRQFENPDQESRIKLLGEEWSAASEGLNLDQILRLKDLQNQNISCEEAIKKI